MRRVHRAHDLVDPHRRGAEGLAHRPQQRGGYVCMTRIEAVRERFVEGGAGDALHCLQYVVSAFDQGRALLDQPVGALAAGIEWRAGDCHHLAALFEGKARGDEAA